MNNKWVLIICAVVAIFFGSALYLKINDGHGNCQQKHPNNRVRIIEHKCHYKSDFGWIESGKTVLPMKKGRYM